MSLRLHWKGGAASLLLPLLVACAAPAPEPLKELYVEPVAGEPGASATPLEPFPFSAKEQGGVFVALRTLDGDRQAAVELLARTLEVWPPPPPGEGQPAPPARPDLSQQALEARPPALMFFLPGVTGRQDSACYVAHCAFAVRGYGRPEVLHHVRLHLINREAHPLRIPLDTLRCEALAGVGGQDGRALSLERRVVADDLGQEVDEMLVPPGGERVWHLFFPSRRLDQALRLGWRVEPVWGPEEDPAPRGPWEMQVALQRRYVLREPLFTELEEIVARGDPLPRAPRGYDPFREPMMEPVPAPPD